MKRTFSWKVGYVSISTADWKYKLFNHDLYNLPKFYVIDTDDNKE